MSLSQNSQYRGFLKHCITGNGMQWKNRTHVLRTPNHDRRVILALRDKGIRLRPSDIQQELHTLFNTAKHLARRGVARSADNSYEFVLAVRRRHNLGRYLSERLSWKHSARL
ncbi:hypothetical protein C8A01DRAFT_31776 [Parachaetomium inaequale]|uniref:Uncharacterized protein n=1 Tax=Parachaetomium inaequale TaxID=2588326 RepID=A0AAN6PQL3_9PEZI|nr:hypothetical protein C8A01DRAFT_31776 [Parachaetomium inaequale]